MALNKGYLTAKTDKASDEYFTPDYAIKPILEFLPCGATIWCPFDKPNSAYATIFRAAGYNVITSHIDEGKNFFFYEPDQPYDFIVSNPPFSIKDAILRRLTELSKPYAILLPLPTLQGQGRYDDLVGCEALVFDRRINFFSDEARTKMARRVVFGSIYVCRGVLPEKLVFRKLTLS